MTLTVHLTDDQSGVASSDEPSDHHGYASLLQLSPLIGTQRMGFSLKRISGTDTSGTYQDTATLPKSSKEGVWTGSLWLADKLGNFQWIEQDQLGSMFGDATIVNTAQADTVTESLPLL